MFTLKYHVLHEHFRVIKVLDLHVYVPKLLLILQLNVDVLHDFTPISRLIKSVHENLDLALHVLVLSDHEALLNDDDVLLKVFTHDGHFTHDVHEVLAAR